MIDRNGNIGLEDDFTLGKAFHKYTKHKLLFFSIIVVAVGLGLTYLYWKTPLYRIQAALVIKDEKKGRINQSYFKGA